MAEDRIELRGLRVAAVVGVLPHERTAAQPLELDLDLHVDTSAAGRSDDLTDTVDYGAVCAAVETVVTESRCQLLEALAEQVADAAFTVDARIEAVTVAVAKLRPPVPQLLASSGVRITRHRP